ncbi:hypothetical protein ACHWQZ_G000474 [Mnemiopsis leidyi]
MLAFGMILLALAGLAAGERHNSILNFPTASTANYISFNPDWPSLNGLTVCSWQKKAYSDTKRYWFSYAVSGTDNEIILGEREAGVYVFNLGGSSFGVTVGAPENRWVHVCATWDSESGVSTISVNGELKKTQVNFRKGWSVTSGGNLAIGQEQDSVGGRFDASQAFVGRLSNINVWDFALNSSDIALMYDAGFCGYSTTAGDPILSYDDVLSQDLNGDATVVEDRSCMDLEDPSDGQVLRFPPQSKASTANFLQFTPDFGTDEYLEFSICTWFFKTYADQGRYFLSYAQSGLYNSIILGEQKTLGNLSQGETKTSGGVMNIGQEQDSVGGTYDASQAFAGSLYNLNMFNIKLTEDQVRAVYANGTFCRKVPDEFWKAGQVMLAYKDLYDLIPDGDVTFDNGEEAWRHGSMHCSSLDLEEDAHKPECWVMEENTEYKNKKNGDLGYVVGTVDEAKAACYATGACKTLTCYQKSGENRCDMKSSFEKSNGDRKKTSYTYRC